MLEGKCEVRKKNDLPTLDFPAITQHVFFCEKIYNAVNKCLNEVHNLIYSFTNLSVVCAFCCAEFILYPVACQTQVYYILKPKGISHFLEDVKERGKL